MPITKKKIPPRSHCTTSGICTYVEHTVIDIHVQRLQDEFVDRGRFGCHGVERFAGQLRSRRDTVYVHAERRQRDDIVREPGCTKRLSSDQFRRREGESVRFGGEGYDREKEGLLQKVNESCEKVLTTRHGLRDHQPRQILLLLHVVVKTTPVRRYATHVGSGSGGGLGDGLLLSPIYKQALRCPFDTMACRYSLYLCVNHNIHHP